MDNPIYIYTLTNPTTGEIRYVGKTKDLRRRLQSHIDYANCNKKRRKITDWITSLLKNGINPIITAIETCDESSWPEREKYWIRYFRENGLNLCNLTDGGESNNGYVYSEDLKKIRSRARLGWIYPASVKKAIANTLNKKVICVETGVVYESLKAATKSSGVPKSTFHRKLHKNELINNYTYQWLNSLKTS